MQEDISPSSTVYRLPHFCQASTLYLTIITSLLLSILLSLIEPNWQQGFWYNLSTFSLFILWTALTSIGILCLTRRYYESISLKKFSLFAITIILAVTLIYSLIVATYLTVDPSPEFLLRNLIVAALISGVFFRYYFLRQESLWRIQSEAEARIQALQSRIRPHFLFNSLNTLANLAAVDPEKTEQMILDMADIFRASMQRSDVLIPFADEKQLCSQYLGLESQRLGNRLSVEWHVNNISDNLLVPPLLLQPLLENAVYHGIQKRPEGGMVTIKGVSYRKYIQLEIANPLPPANASNHKGNSMALKNIRQRLEVIYGNKAQLNYHQSQEYFYCLVKIPKQL